MATQQRVPVGSKCGREFVRVERARKMLSASLRLGRFTSDIAHFDDGPRYMKSITVSDAKPSAEP